MKEIKEKMDMLNDLLKEINMDLLDDSLIKDNMLPFMKDGDVFRTIMPTQEDLILAKNVEDKLKIKLLKDDGTVTRNQLIKILKENQDIDIVKLEKTRDNYSNKLKDLYIALATSTDKEEVRLINLKGKILETKTKYLQLSCEINDYLSSSIENQVEVEYMRFLTFRCTEKNEEGKWIQVWNTIEDFNQDRSSLPNLAKICFSRLYMTLRS